MAMHPTSTIIDEPRAPAAGDLKISSWSTVRRILQPIASLKLTVALFAMAIFLTLAGTFAQVELDIWQVIDGYFRTWVAWIDFQLFFPPSFFPSRPQVPGGFYFPGGWIIGGLMFINLLAAHSVRFTAQAKGARLLAGLAVIVVGILVTWLVIASGSNPDGVQGQSWIAWSTLWQLLKVALGLLWLAALAALVRVKDQRPVERWSLAAAVVGLGLLLTWLVFSGNAVRLDDSGMRILWQLLKGAFAGGVLLAGCFIVFKKRAGIVLLHAGVGLMMLNELLVGLMAVESQMPIEEGRTANFVQDIRTVELAVVDTSNAETDQVVSVPKSFLIGKDVISHEDLPFDIKVVEFLQNSRLLRAQPDADNPATAGAGLIWSAEEVRPGAGTDSSGEIDMTSAYVQFIDKETSQPLGTYLLNVLLADEDPQQVTVGDKPYEVALRFKRTYKPYSLRLIDVRKDDYIGTATPRNYSSDVQLVDEERGVDRKVHIWMNNPLRFAGETFYQSGYHLDPRTGKESTTLQVVTNAGWMIPYVACMIVAVGMLFQFSNTLSRFVKRRASEVKTQEAATLINDKQSGPVPASLRDKADRARWVNVLVPLVIVAALGGWLVSKARVPAPVAGQLDTYEFGQLPVVFEGRIKPVDTLARNSLLIISDRQTFVDAEGEDQPAIRWFLDMVARPDVGFTHKVFRIENFEVLDLLGLEPRIVRDKRLSFRYALDEFQDKIGELAKQADMARKVNAIDMSVYQKKVLELEQKLGTVYLLMQAFTPPQIRPDHAKEDLFAAIQQQEALAQRNPGPPLMIPPQNSNEGWETYATAWTKDLVRSMVMKSEANPATQDMSKILDAYADDDAQAFNSEVADYRTLLAQDPPENLDLEKTDFEAFFNHFAPFYYASFAYLFAFVITALGWLGWTRGFNRTAFWLIVVTFAVHTFALGARIYISGRPPVTNLYSSAVFIGWGGVVLGLVLEMVYRLGIGNIIAAIAGSSTLGIAHFLAADGDTFVVLQAVLDTQFWLATHVVIVTLGYMTTFVAGFLGILYILRGVFTPSLSPQVGRDLARMIYGTLCFSLFFSFVGTVLGGLWADDSWGRFWGWDPKENGALIIVLWNALVLHARWGKMVKDRGMATLCVAGNIAVGWSWFGVNELGIGLHSYGFTEGVLRSLGLFALSQLAIIAVGLLPLHIWWSVRRQDELAKS